MDERMKTNEDFSEVNLKRLIDALLDKAWVVLLSSVIGALIVFAMTYFFVTPQYESAAMFYVNNNSISVGEASLSISSADISASKSLVNTYIVILNTRETMHDVIDYAGVQRSYAELEEMIEAESVDDTEVFRVIVTSDDPQEANKIASAISYILPKRISSIVEGTSAKVVDSAVVPSRPSSPSYTMNTVIGFLLGFVLSAGLVVMQEMMDVTIRNDEDLTQICKHPILAQVPDMNAPSKGKTYYYASSKKTARDGAAAAVKPEKMKNIGSDIGFAASEAYKLLRTKLQFSFSDDHNCRVIGLSSALSGEGKSLTSVNLAFTLAQLNKRVLLVDCDMRRPTLAEKMELRKHPGLSSYLTRQSNLKNIIQQYNGQAYENSFDVIAAGQNPPNPIELLSSERMKEGLAQMRENYDYVILDLPPVGEVSDAMAVAKDTDGMLLVVRQNYCDRIVLAEAIQQFAFIQSKILGVVFNCTTDHGGQYGKGYYKRYYRRYYHRYYRNYAHSYENTGRSVSDTNSKSTKV